MFVPGEYKLQSKQIDFIELIYFPIFIINSKFGEKICRDDHLCENTIQKIPKSYMTCRLGGRSQKEPN